MKQTTTKNFIIISLNSLSLSFITRKRKILHYFISSFSNYYYIFQIYFNVLQPKKVKQKRDMDLDLIMESLKADNTMHDTGNYLIVDDGDYGNNEFGNNNNNSTRRK